CEPERMQTTLESQTQRDFAGHSDPTQLGGEQRANQPVTNTNVQWTPRAERRIVLRRSPGEKRTSWKLLSYPSLMTMSPSASRCPTCSGNSASRCGHFRQQKSSSPPIVWTRLVV